MRFQAQCTKERVDLGITPVCVGEVRYSRPRVIERSTDEIRELTLQQVRQSSIEEFKQREVETRVSEISWHFVHRDVRLQDDAKAEGQKNETGEQVQQSAASPPTLPLRAFCNLGHRAPARSFLKASEFVLKVTRHS